MTLPTLTMDQVQAAIVQNLRANPTLVAEFTNQFGVEIREDNWEGTDFTYPAVRVGIISDVPYGNGPCRPFMGTYDVVLYVYAEGSSSKACAKLTGVVRNVAQGLLISSSTIVPVSVMDVTNVSYPVPDMGKERLWRGEIMASVLLKEKATV